MEVLGKKEMAAPSALYAAVSSKLASVPAMNRSFTVSARRANECLNAIPDLPRHFVSSTRIAAQARQRRMKSQPLKIAELASNDMTDGSGTALIVRLLK
jgi:hypothetical protein